MAGVSHEINTPVGIAITALSNLKERAKNLFDSAVEGKMTRSAFDIFSKDTEQNLSSALLSLYKASDLVDKFKQIAVDRSQERLCEIKFDQLMQDVISASMLNATINADDVIINCPKNLILMTYPDAFAKVFSHLVHNTQIHGYLPGEPVDISINANQQGRDIVIIYRDEGKGMDSQTLAHIFDPFYTTNRIGGTGLGMHVVYNQVCQLLKGKITCHSQPGQGCEFVLRLPVGVL
jgi:Amt family ammonium transporter